MISLEELLRIFTARGDKVVVVPPKGDVAVLMPLTEYDKLRSTLEVASAITPKSKIISPNKFITNNTTIESVDPTINSITNDDQYFPEPIEE